MLTAARAELIQLKTIRRITTILRRNVITLLALSACQRNAWTDVGAFACHFVHLYNSLLASQSPTGRCSEEETRTDLQSAPFDHLGNPPAVSVRSKLQTATLLFCHESETNASLRHAESRNL